MGRGGSSKRMWEKRDKGGGGKSESRNRQPATQKKRAITGDLTSGCRACLFHTITERCCGDFRPAPIHERPVDFYSPISKTVSRILGLPSHTSRIVVVEYGTRRGTSWSSSGIRRSALYDEYCTHRGSSPSGVLKKVHSTTTAHSSNTAERAVHTQAWAVLDLRYAGQYESGTENTHPVLRMNYEPRIIYYHHARSHTFPHPILTVSGEAVVVTHPFSPTGYPHALHASCAPCARVNTSAEAVGASTPAVQHECGCAVLLTVHIHACAVGTLRSLREHTGAWYTVADSTRAIAWWTSP
ncbi:hypothetical protein DFP72DRAFT_1048043 [Ephemerocybe angulata]|uniref:Uncharacterized protein n=1 Tax=Ephemerocybe angulata TaxID=980116 RepID=A0A8H6HQN0_9AGAR|nr:hypothetical protein DFP72DRAFT_1048043 [Tulosesus angulatus]